MDRSLVGLAVRIDKTAALQENPKKITLRRRDRRGKKNTEDRSDRNELGASDVLGCCVVVREGH
jgi:hypothetical protein